MNTMSQERRDEFRALVKAAHDDIDEYVEAFPSGDWFTRGLDDRVRNAVEELLAWGVKQRPMTDEEKRRATGIITPPPTKTAAAAALTGRRLTYFRTDRQTLMCVTVVSLDRGEVSV